MNSPRVAILTTTYNHAPFIAQAVESVAMQKTTFPIKMIIGEDCSTDETRAVLLQLKQKYPDLLDLRLREVNYGRRRNFVDLFYACKADYVALLEGDDFWTSPDKLQKQVDFMEQNQDCAIIFHPIDRLEGNGQKFDFCPPIFKEKYDLTDLLKGNFIGTCSVMYRRQLVPQLPDWFNVVSAGDYPLHILYATQGKIGFLPEKMATYRIHDGGVWSSQPFIQQLLNTIQYTEFVRDYVPTPYKPYLNEQLALYHLRVINRRRQAKEYKKVIQQLFHCLFQSKISPTILWRVYQKHLSL